MVHYQCGSCSYRTDDLGEAQQHSRETGHVCVGKEVAEPTARKFGRTKGLAVAGVGVLAATTIGVITWKYKKLQEDHEELQEDHEELQTKHEGLVSMAAGLLSQLAESTAENESLKSENDYLKSATGASKTLKSYDR
ncbi:hypothetical protein [Streptomyces sp. C]|uniref:hypothetical protein n=1 Tax=Streptomyces sp. C TaxID=253839 RepID=UPI00101B5574|nr:hypothetical protein [Streptomyces sp. C]